MGNTRYAGIVLKLINEVIRVLAEEDNFICIFNSHPHYRTEIIRRIGPVARLTRHWQNRQKVPEIKTELMGLVSEAVLGFIPSAQIVHLEAVVQR